MPRVKSFPAEVKRELAAARKTYNCLHSPHEGLAVIWEEFSELQECVFRRYWVETEARRELVQIAAMCQRMAEDLQLLSD